MKDTESQDRKKLYTQSFCAVIQMIGKEDIVITFKSWGNTSRIMVTIEAGISLQRYKLDRFSLLLDELWKWTYT